MPSLSGSFLRSSANLGKFCSLCTESCIDYTNVNSLATCYLHGSLEQSFSYNDSFNFYNYVSEPEQFSYQHDVMNKSNMFTLSLVNETLWDLNESIITQKTTSNEVNVPLVNTIHDSSTIVTGRDNNDKVVHRSYGFIPLGIPEYYCTNEGSQSGFEPTKQWLQKIHQQVSSYGVPNYKGVYIRVPSTLNV